MDGPVTRPSHRERRPSVASFLPPIIAIDSRERCPKERSARRSKVERSVQERHKRKRDSFIFCTINNHMKSDNDRHDDDYGDVMTMMKSITVTRASLASYHQSSDPPSFKRDVRTESGGALPWDDRNRKPVRVVGAVLDPPSVSPEIPVLTPVCDRGGPEDGFRSRRASKRLDCGRGVSVFLWSSFLIRLQLQTALDYLVQCRYI